MSQDFFIFTFIHEELNEEQQRYGVQIDVLLVLSKFDYFTPTKVGVSDTSRIRR